MSDIDQIAEDAEPEPLEIKIRGRSFSVKQFNMLQLGRIQKAIRKLPCPSNTRAVRAEWSRKKAAGECTDAELMQAVGRAAAEEESWPPQLLNDPGAMELVMYEEPVQVAFLREALGLPSLADAEAMLPSVSPTAFVRMFVHCFNILQGGDSGPKQPASGDDANASTTTSSSPTSSPAPDGAENTSSGSPSPTSSDTPGCSTPSSRPSGGSSDDDAPISLEVEGRYLPTGGAAGDGPQSGPGDPVRPG